MRSGLTQPEGLLAYVVNGAQCPEPRAWSSLNACPADSQIWAARGQMVRYDR